VVVAVFSSGTKVFGSLDTESGNNHHHHGTAVKLEKLEKLVDYFIYSAAHVVPEMVKKSSLSKRVGDSE
jgi:gamma-glutamylcyclotransferase (GGCT)/AIG2-like uncharacterized protein YtfP